MMTAKAQRRVVRGARIVRFEQGRRTSYTDGALIWLSPAELVKYQFIVEPVPAPVVKAPTKEAAPAVAPEPATAAKQEPKHEVRNVVPPTAFTPKK